MSQELIVKNKYFILEYITYILKQSEPNISFEEYMYFLNSEEEFLFTGFYIRSLTGCHCKSSELVNRIGVLCSMLVRV